MTFLTSSGLSLRSIPWTMTLPLVTSSRVDRTRRVVVFPAPLGPMRP